MEEFSGLRSRVVRIGRTVRREVHQNTPAVKALLSHLEETGFAAAPRWFGFDEEGREILSYITGTAGHYPLKPYVLSESTLRRLGLLLRRFHDATISFSLPEDVVWQNAISTKREVICHGDAGPYNIIFRNNQPIALIDFERATPGPRVWDIAFVVYRFAPLCDAPEHEFTPAFLQKIARRIRIFLNAYGFSQNDDLFDWMQLRLKTEIGLFESETNDDPIRRQKKIEAGHLDLYKRDLRLIEELSGDLRALI
jgi:tRNA A-37 threonylcarbamoyl transferase component Bud32